MVNMTCPVIHKPTDPVPFIGNGDIHFKAHDVGWIVSGFFALIATCASIWLIWKHLTYYTCPPQQRHIVRMLIMVPIYAIVSFLSYIFFTEAIYYETIRDCYEAVVITSFFYLLLQYVGDTPAEQHEVFKEVKVKYWFFPLGFWKYRPDGLHFLWLMKICILQYAIVRPVCTLVAVGLQYFGIYCIESWAPQFGHIYISIAISISVSVAMYCIIQFYLPIKEELKPYSPVLKFLAVKSVVFLTFWQSSFLSILAYFGAIKDTQYMSAAEVQVGLNALLETFEMVIFGFLHIKAFTYLIYRPEDRARTTRRGRAMLDVLDFRDWYYQMSQSTRYVVAKSKGRPFTIVEDIRRQKYEHLSRALGHDRWTHLEMERERGKADQPSFWKPGCEPTAEDEELLEDEKSSGATPSTAVGLAATDVEKKAASSSTTTPSQTNARSRTAEQRRTSKAVTGGQARESRLADDTKEERRPRGNLALRKDFDPERDQRDLDADPSEKDIGTDSKESLAAPRLPQLKYNAEERRELRVVTSKTRTRDAYPELTAFHAIAQEEDDFIPGLEDDEKRELAQDEEEDGDEDGIYIPRKGGRARKEGSLGLGAFWRKFRERISGTQDGAEGEAMEEQETEGLGMHPEGEAEILTPPRPIRSDSGSSDATESALRTSDSPLSQFIHDQRSQNAPQKGNPPPRIAFQQAHPPQIQTFKARQTAQIGAVESPELFAGSTPALSRASSAAHAEPSQTRDNARLPPPPQELAPADNKELVSNVTGKKAVQDSVIHRPPERQPAASVHPSVGTITSAAVSRTSLPSHGPAPVAVPLFASSPPPPPVVAPAQPLTATNLASHQSARIEPPPQRQLSGNSVITMTTTTTQQQQQQQQQQAKTAGAPKRTATSKDVKGRKISLVLPQPLNPEGQLPPPAAPVEAPVAVHAQPAPPPTTTSGGSVVSAPRTSKIQFAPESVGRKSHQQKNKVSAATATTVTKSWRDDPEAEPPKYPLGRVVQGGKSLAQLQAEAKQAEEEEKKRRREEEERLAMERRREAQRRQREEWERGQERERRRREQEQADAARHYQQQQQRAVDGGEGGSTIRDHRPRRSSAPVAPPAQEEARTWFFGKKKAKEPDPFTFLPAPSLMQASPSDLDDPFAAASSAIQQQQQSPTRDGEPKSGSNLVGVGASGAATSRSRHMSLGMIPHNQTFDVGSIITPRDMARHDVQVQVKPYPQGVPRPYEQPRHHYHLQQQQQQQQQGQPYPHPRPLQQPHQPRPHVQQPPPPPHHYQQQQPRPLHHQKHPQHHQPAAPVVPRQAPLRQFSAPPPGARYWAENGYSSVRPPAHAQPQPRPLPAPAPAPRHRSSTGTQPHLQPSPQAHLQVDQQRRSGRRASYDRYTGEPSWIGDGQRQPPQQQQQQQQQQHPPHHPSQRQQGQPANGHYSNRAPPPPAQQRPDPRGTKAGYQAPEGFRFDYID